MGKREVKDVDKDQILDFPGRRNTWPESWAMSLFGAKATLSSSPYTSAGLFDHEIHEC